MSNEIPITGDTLGNNSQDLENQTKLPYVANYVNLTKQLLDWNLSPDTDLLEGLSNDPSKAEALIEMVDGMLASLSHRESIILQTRFGLKDGQSRTLKATGKIFNVSGSRIGQLEARAFRKLHLAQRSMRLFGQQVSSLIQQS